MGERRREGGREGGERGRERAFTAEYVIDIKYCREDILNYIYLFLQKIKML